MLCILVRIDLKYLAYAVIMVPLLQELFFVGRGIALDEVLQLRQVRRAEYAARHRRKDCGEGERRAVDARGDRCSKFPRFVAMDFAGFRALLRVRLARRRDDPLQRTVPLHCDTWSLV